MADLADCGDIVEDDVYPIARKARKAVVAQPRPRRRKAFPAAEEVAPEGAAADAKEEDGDEEIIIHEPCSLCKLETKGTRRFCAGRGQSTYIHHPCSNA
jgi:hypothetical protein